MAADAAGGMMSMKREAFIALLLLCARSPTAAAATAPVVVVVSAGGNRTVTLEVAGSGAFRVGVDLVSARRAAAAAGWHRPLDTPMLPGDRQNAAGVAAHWTGGGGCGPGVGIRADFGAVRIANDTSSGEAVLTLMDANGAEIIRSVLLPPLLPPAHEATPPCENSGQDNTDKVDGNRLKASTEDLQSDCCASCLA